MSYCKLGEKSKVTYQFQNGESTTYESAISPIDVTTGKANPSGTTTNYNPQGYRITFNSPQGNFGQIQITVLDYQLYTNGGTNYIRSIPCGGTSYPKNPDGSIVDTAYGGAVITSPVVIDNSVHCPVIATDDQCQITILNNGQTLFQAHGNCPVTFNVACGEECPNGYCKIDCETYPGYCCISEAKIQGFINGLK